MINKVVLKNFQAHTNTVINLSSGVNVITGKTDSGKSAIIRAIRWVVLNDPPGTEFCSWHGSPTEVQIHCDDFVIARIRTATKNQYKLFTTRGTDGTISLEKNHAQCFESFKQSVPIEIQQLLQMDAENFQCQLDGVFLLNESAGAVARHFNKVTDIEIIGITQSVCTAKVDALEATLQARKHALSESQKELRQYDNLNDFEAHVEDLEDLQRHTTMVAAQIVELSKCIQQYTEQDQTLNELQTTSKLQCLPKITQMLQLIEVLNTQQKQHDELLQYIQQQQDVCTYITTLKTGLHTAEKQRPSICPFCHQKIKTTPK